MDTAKDQAPDEVVRALSAARYGGIDATARLHRLFYCWRSIEGWERKYIVSEVVRDLAETLEAAKAAERAIDSLSQSDVGEAA